MKVISFCIEANAFRYLLAYEIDNSYLCPKFLLDYSNFINLRHVY